MSRDLVRESFRYSNGQMARNQSVSLVYRGTNALALPYATETGLEPLSNPLVTDSLGNLAFYLAPGLYDFLVLGVRVPFDVEPDVSLEITEAQLDDVADQVLLELELPNLVLLYDNVKI